MKKYDLKGIYCLSETGVATCYTDTKVLNEAQVLNMLAKALVTKDWLDKVEENLRAILRGDAPPNRAKDPLSGAELLP